MSINSIHGHTILRWLSDATAPLSLGEIEARLSVAGIGELRFHTCDTEGLDLGELLALLETRGKLWRVGACYVSERARICAEHA
jgi:probable metal-binding protein